MKNTVAEIEQARQHIRDAEARVIAQCNLIDQMARGDYPTQEAEERLSLMLTILDQMRDHLREMTKDDI
jgi:hypothetical protein